MSMPVGVNICGPEAAHKKANRIRGTSFHHPGKKMAGSVQTLVHQTVIVVSMDMCAVY